MVFVVPPWATCATVGSPPPCHATMTIGKGGGMGGGGGKGRRRKGGAGHGEASTIVHDLRFQNLNTQVLFHCRHFAL